MRPRPTPCPYCLGCVRPIDRVGYGLTASGGEGNRLIDGGGVRIDSTVVSDKGLKLGAGAYVLQVGKRKFVRVTLA